MVYRLGKGHSLQSALASACPVRDRAIVETSLCEMVREQLRLVGHRVGEFSLEYLRDFRMPLTGFALKQ